MSGSNLSLALACCAMAALTFTVALVMMRRRIATIRENRIRLSEIASPGQLQAKIPDSRASDNFKNLAEFPVLFYVLCLLAITLNVKSDIISAVAWLYVALRGAHSFIHCTYNKVYHRFLAFTASVVVLMAMWIILMIKLIQM